ncbi:MAG: protein arginine kinase [Oscillospiraceae bacterium]|nr:protein arginine kinase [Candidatus Ruminococcus equi]
MSEVVVKTRVRLARNLKDYPFECRLNADEKKEIAEKVCKILEKSEYDFTRYDMEKLSQVDKIALVERHLISPEFVSNNAGAVALISSNEEISIMLNEEDHIRLQIIKNGLFLEEAYEIADKLDDILSEKLEFAFSEKLGYLTQCPTNLGTAMRASVMLHLPALQKSHAVVRIGNNLSKLGLTIRGMYGESSKPSGALYQLSNQVTLGISEKAAIENLKNITNQLITQEIKSRASLSSDISVVDTVSRSLGILKTARIISSDEAMNLLSNVRFGVSVKLLETLSLDSIDELICEIQPASIMKKYGTELTVSERDIKRADFLREKLN